MKKLAMYMLMLCIAIATGCGPGNTAQKEAWTDVKKEKNTFTIGSYKVGEKFEKRTFKGTELNQLKPGIYAYEPHKIHVFITNDGLVAGTAKLFVQYENQTEAFAKTFEHKFNIKLNKSEETYSFFAGDLMIIVWTVEKCPYLLIASKKLWTQKEEEEKIREEQEKINIPFGPYKVGEKFVNQGFEGAELQPSQEELFFYTSKATREKGKNFLEIWTTQDGTIAQISKEYTDYWATSNTKRCNVKSSKDFIKIFENKLKLPLQGRYYSYDYIAGDIKIEIKTCGWEWYSEWRDPSVTVHSEKLWEQRKRDIEAEKQAKENERIQQAAEQFEI